MSHLHAQSTVEKTFVSQKNAQALNDLYATKGRFIQNIGQYGDSLKEAQGMGEIQFAYEGLDMPVLFTAKGIIHLHRKVKGPTEREQEALEKMGIKREIIAQKTEVIEKWIAMEFVNSNSDVKILF